LPLCGSLSHGPDRQSSAGSRWLDAKHESRLELVGAGGVDDDLIDDCRPAFVFVPPGVERQDGLRRNLASQTRGGEPVLRVSTPRPRVREMRFLRRRRGDDIFERELFLGTLPADLQLGESVLDRDLPVAIVGMQTDDGVPVLPVFTSEANLVEAKPDGGPWIALSGRDALAAFLSGEWEAMVIDPTDSTGRWISREEAERLLADG
jgi:hypothetical protein